MSYWLNPPYSYHPSDPPHIFMSLKDLDLTLTEEELPDDSILGEFKQYLQRFAPEIRRQILSELTAQSGAVEWKANPRFILQGPPTDLMVESAIAFYSSNVFVLKPHQVEKAATRCLFGLLGSCGESSPSTYIQHLCVAIPEANISPPLLADPYPPLLVKGPLSDVFGFRNLKTLNLSVRKRTSRPLQAFDFVRDLYRFREEVPRCKITVRASVADKSMMDYEEMLGALVSDMPVELPRPIDWKDVTSLFNPPSAEEQAYVAERYPHQKSRRSRIPSMLMGGEPAWLNGGLLAKDDRLFRVVMAEYLQVESDAERARLVHEINDIV